MRAISATSSACRARRLREALKFLASEGLLELSPGRGAVVRKFLAKDVQDSLIVLAHLESLAGRLACKNATDDEIRRDPRHA